MKKTYSLQLFGKLAALRNILKINKCIITNY